MTATPTLLSLFDHSGNWSKFYRDAGWNVVQVDIQNGIDIFDFDYTQYENVQGLIIAVPCTDFAASGARWWKEKDANGATAYSIKMVERSLEIVTYWKARGLKFWALENPIGRIAKLCGLGKPIFKFDPCDFGKLYNEDYTKKTCLWGEFVAPTPVALGEDLWIPPLAGSKMHTLPATKDRQRLRSVTPLGFSHAFFQCNH